MKNLKLITLALFVPLHFFSQGLNFSSAEELSQISEAPSDYGFATDLPAKYSLEKYVPPVQRQVGGTCVGFSTFYYALSTMYNIEFNIIKESDKLAHSFDPYFIYSLSYINTDNCDAGLNFKPVFTKLNEIGSKKLFFPPFTSCDEKWTEEKFVNTVSYTQAYSINQYYKIPIERPNFNELVKQAITYRLPVVIGLETTDSMDAYSSSNTSGIGSSGLWTPSANEKGAGGHALCVVGYDNSMYGGSFRIVNSWGKKFGDNGYMWITYDDFKKYTVEAYFMELNENVESRPQFKDGLRTENYRRYGYETSNGSINTYEGQYLSNSNTGYGIWLDENNDTHYIGEFNDGLRNGEFRVINTDGIFRAFYRNTVLVDPPSYGFGQEDDELLKEQLSATKYFDRLGLEINDIRKSNSSSSNLVKPQGIE